MSGILAGKTAVVTGGSTGIGHATALALGRAGANVMIGDLRPDPKPGSYDERPDLTIVDLLKDEGHDAAFQTTDVTKADQVRALAEAAATRFGGIDIWVNNAGVVAAMKAMQDYEDDEFDLCLDVNVRGLWNGLRAAIPYMQKSGNGGSIVNVISTAGLRPHPLQSPYDISKAAAAQATRCAALELGADKIRVNGVCPTVVKTAISRFMVEMPGFEEFISSKLALGALVETKQVADAVLFLASDAASAITGVLLPVDMGESLGPPSEKGLV